MDIFKLISDVHSGKLDIKDLTFEESEQVLDGYRELAYGFLNEESTKKLGEAILKILVDAGLDDPFEVAIERAEARGSTYWELETNSVH